MLSSLDFGSISNGPTKMATFKRPKDVSVAAAPALGPVHHSKNDKLKEDLGLGMPSIQVIVVKVARSHSIGFFEFFLSGSQFPKTLCCHCQPVADIVPLDDLSSAESDGSDAASEASEKASGAHFNA